MIEVALMSLLLYTGAGQFMAAWIMAAVSAMIFTYIFVNRRHLLLH
jgi:predicted branched-subunit amino acid permease